MISETKLSTPGALNTELWRPGVTVGDGVLVVLGLEEERGQVAILMSEVSLQMSC